VGAPGALRLSSSSLEDLDALWLAFVLDEELEEVEEEAFFFLVPPAMPAIISRTATAMATQNQG